ncbi:MAG: hypothetical protein ACLPKB_15465 [Xanthobacteraceae bacterium]
MANGSTEKSTGQPIIAPGRRDEVLGLVKLLTLAQASADACRADDMCAALLERCIKGLLASHGMSSPNPSQSMPTAEFIPYPTLLRVLAYARAEMLDPLNDVVSAQLLTECIKLMIAFRPAQNEFSPLPSSLTYN